MIVSTYSTQLRTIIEQPSQYNPTLSHAERIEIGRKHLFNFKYPIFDEKYRATFETNFIRNFYMREIGFEVEYLFKFHLETWLNINMPYYNNLFLSEINDFNPFHNVDLAEKYTLKKDSNKDDKIDSKTKDTQTGSTNSTGTGQTTGVNFSRNLKSDTPQDRLAITTKEGSGVIQYASSIDEDKSNGKNDSKTTGKTDVKGLTDGTANTTGNTKIKSTDDYIRQLTGKQGNQSYSEMLLEYRKTFLRIERDIHKELNQLFMLIY